MFIRITWETTVDERNCPVCRALNGFTWTFQVAADQMGDELIHPEYGVVWNTTRGSQAHGHTNIHCRCHLIPEVNVEDLKWHIEQARNKLEAMLR